MACSSLSRVLRAPVLRSLAAERRWASWRSEEAGGGWAGLPFLAPRHPAADSPAVRGFLRPPSAPTAHCPPVDPRPARRPGPLSPVACLKPCCAVHQSTGLGHASRASEYLPPARAPSACAPCPEAEGIRPRLPPTRPTAPRPCPRRPARSASPPLVRFGSSGVHPGSPKAAARPGDPPQRFRPGRAPCDHRARAEGSSRQA